MGHAPTMAVSMSWSTTSQPRANIRRRTTTPGLGYGRPLKSLSEIITSTGCAGPEAEGEGDCWNRVLRATVDDTIVIDVQPRSIAVSGSSSGSDTMRSSWHSVVARSRMPDKRAQETRRRLHLVPPSAAGNRLSNGLFRDLPCRHRDQVRRGGQCLAPEEVQMCDNADQVLENIGPVVDEMGDPELATYRSLVSTLAYEPNVIRTYARGGVEVMVG